MWFDNLKIVVIIPVYNESDALYENFKAIEKTLKDNSITCEYLLVDDGSIDDTWRVIERLKVEKHAIKGIRFAKNFGKELALSAGIEQIDADLYVLMDSDLQHPPSQVLPMLEQMNTQCADIVEGIKDFRGNESFLHRCIAKSFYNVLRWVTHLDMQNSSDFKIINRKVVDELRKFNERNVFFRGVVDWVGFKKVKHRFSVADRQYGESRFSTSRLAKLAVDAIVSHTGKPLYLVTLSGLIFGIFALILGVQTLYNFFSGNALNGFSTVILILLVTGAMIMFSLGIIGTYISRIYEEIKARPRYIIKDEL